MKKVVISIMQVVSWMLNAAALVGYFLLRRRINAPTTVSNKPRFLIIRPYKSEVDADGNIMCDNEHDELDLMSRLFRTAHDYGNAKVVVVANNGDPGLCKIRDLACAYADITQVIEADIMPPDTASGQMFNHKVGWAAFAPIAQDDDILLTTDCDSDLTLTLLNQIAAAYEDSKVGGVGTYALYQPAVDWPAANYTMAVNPGMGFLALATALTGAKTMPGNLLSMRVSVFRQFGGFDSYSPIEQLVDDVATSNKVLSTGRKLALVGNIRVYNRYTSFTSWWQRWTRMTVMMRHTAPHLYWPSPLPTYGAQTMAELIMLYALLTKQPKVALPFVANWGINIAYSGITGGWRDGLASPFLAVLNLAGWLYALLTRSKTVKWRGIEYKIDQELAPPTSKADMVS